MEYTTVRFLTLAYYKFILSLRKYVKAFSVHFPDPQIKMQDAGCSGVTSIPFIIQVRLHHTHDNFFPHTCLYSSWLAGFSGCHRFEAHQRLNMKTIKCRVRRGTEATLRCVEFESALSEEAVGGYLTSQFHQPALAWSCRMHMK